MKSSETVYLSELAKRLQTQEKNIKLLTEPVVSTQHSLYTRYSSSQHYFFSSKITDIINEKTCLNNIIFEEIETYLDEQQYLKRQYNINEYSRKLATFKEYYFYHEDCPRIFGNLPIAESYEKWHEKKRDYIYKKLKLMYNETYSSMNSSSHTVQEPNQNQTNMSHFLLEISDYNPFSKKYYLRVQARLEKEQDQKEKEKNNGKIKENINETAEIFQNLKTNLSQMIEGINNQLSMLTVADEKQKKHNYMLQFNRIGGKTGIKYLEKSNDSNKNLTLKLNFLKKQYVEPFDNVKTKKRIQIESPEKQKMIGFQSEDLGYTTNRPRSKNNKRQSQRNTNNDFQLSNNLISQEAKKSLLLMSSLGYKNYVGSQKMVQKQRSYGMNKKNEKRTSPAIEKYGVLKSYNSLEKLNRYKHMEPITISKQPQLVHKIHLNPDRQRAIIVGDIINKKLDNHQSSLKKKGSEIERLNVEEFNDRKIININNKLQGVSNYQSKRNEPTSSASAPNINLPHSRNASDISKRVKPQNTPAQGLKSQRKIFKEPETEAPRKKAIRINFKINNFKVINNL